MRSHLILILSLTACNAEYGISVGKEPVDEGGLPQDIEDGIVTPVLPDLDTDDGIDTDVADTDTDTDADTDIAVDSAAPGDTALAQGDTDTDPPILIDTAPVVVIDTSTPARVPTAPLINLSSDLQWPESGDWDDVGRAFFVGSLELGHVLRVGPAGGETVFFEDTTPGETWQTWGIEADRTRRLLYVCARRDGYPWADWFTWVLDLDTGVRLHSFDMATAGTRAQCRDFTVAQDGTVYITDRQNPWIHRLQIGSTGLVKWADDPRLDRVTWGMDGIAITPAGDAVLVNKSKPGDLLRVSTSDPTDISVVSLNGTGFGLRAGHGLDGMTFHGGDLWIAAVDRLVQITPTTSAWAAGTRQVWSSPIDGVSGLTVADGELYSINGDPFAWTLGIQADLPFEINRIDTSALGVAPP